MNEKKQLILHKSIQLFSRKGFADTSVQEIATACGISKGAFYLHFQSKEALLLALLQHHFQLVSGQLAAIESENLSPRGMFIAQIERQADEIPFHKEFLIMQARENAIPFNEEISAFLFKMRAETHRFFRNHLLAMYGDTIEPYSWDLAVALQGIQQSFLQLTIVDHAQFDARQMANFLLACADDLEAGFRRRSQKPVLDPDSMHKLFQPKITLSVLLTWLTELKKTSFNEDIIVSLEVIEQEITRNEPRAAVLRGMLVNLPGEPQLLEFVKALKEYCRL